MFGTPKGEVIICNECKRIHDIRRGTFIVCACGEIIKSKQYNPETMEKYLENVNNGNI